MSSQPRWRDFAHTVSVKLAGALASHEATARASAAPPTRVVRQTFTFALLAAATGETPRLPTGGYEAAEGGLTLSTATGAGRIRVALQLEGLDALEAGAGREARLVSDDGSLDGVVRFDDQGQASLAVDDSDSMRAALTRLRVDVLDE